MVLSDSRRSSDVESALGEDTVSQAGDDSDCETESEADSDDLTTDGSRQADALALAASKSSQAVAAPSFGNVSVSNSTDVHFGNKTVYQGPVTIKQFVYAGGTSDYIPESSDDSGIGDSGGVSPSILFKNGAGGPDFTPSPFGVVNSEPNCDRLQCMSDFQKSFQQPTKRGGKWPLARCLQETANSRRCMWAAAIVLVGAVAAVAGLVAGGVLRRSQRPSTAEEYLEHEYNRPAVVPNATVTLSNKLRIIQRREWVAQPPIETTPLDHPVPYVIISHTATESCKTQADCTFNIRFLQTFHMDSRGWSDIAYNFVIGGDGYAYEGRGWDTVAAHSYGYNTRSIGISFVGTFKTHAPPPQSLLAAQQLIALGVNLGKIAHNYTLLTHRQVSNTESPGQAVYDIIQTWPHWRLTP